MCLSSILTSNILLRIYIQTYNADSICFIKVMPLDLMPGMKKIAAVDKTGFISITIYNCFESVSMDILKV